jgi:hypothetical protein
MRHIPILIACCGAAIAGCAPAPPPPAIFVDTVPPGALCVLSRQGQPIARVDPTPGIALVGEDGGDIAIECRRNGFNDAAADVAAHDAASGFDQLLWQRQYRYDSPVTIRLTPKS